MRLFSIYCVALGLAGSAYAQELAELHASDPGARDVFGQSVSISGNTILVGSSNHSVASQRRGAAYVYVGSDTTWAQQAELTAADGQANDSFGCCVAISGDTTVIGAFRDDLVDGSHNHEGSVYVFVRGGTVWSQQAKLTASDAAAGDLFGIAVAINVDTIAIGAPYDDDLGSNSGSVYVFVRSGTAWSQQAKLTASDGAAGDLFGSALSLDGDNLLVGAPHHDDVASNSGSAYVFVRSGTSWSQQAKLGASDAAANDSYGRSVSLLGDSLVVGAFQKQQHGIDSGCAYVSTRSGTTWTERTKLVASDAASFDYFGKSVSLAPGAIVIGACQKNVVGTASGAAYLFVGSGATWTQTRRLTPNNQSPREFFAGGVSASGGLTVIGAAFEDDTAMNSGSAHVFWTESPGVSFCAGDGSLSTPCPCGNSGITGHGCDNSVGTGGSILFSGGVASLAADTVQLSCQGERATALSVFLQGHNIINPTNYGDGLRCIGGTLKRLYVKAAVGGIVTAPQGNELSVSARSAALGDPIVMGTTLHYQTYYRDPDPTFCPNPPGNTWNVSNALSILWSP